MLERERELATLESMVGAAIDGEATLAIVEGRAGIGKSALIQATRERAAESGFRTLSARGTDLEREFPYGVVRQLFEPLRTDPAEWERLLGGSAAAARSVFDTPAAGDGALQDASFGALHGLFWLTVNLASEDPSCCRSTTCTGAIRRRCASWPTSPRAWKACRWSCSPGCAAPIPAWTRACWPTWRPARPP